MAKENIVYRFSSGIIYPDKLFPFADDGGGNLFYFKAPLFLT